MNEYQYSRLVSALTIGPVTVRNRMVFTAHDTLLQKEGAITDACIAYHEARAIGGAGLQILAAAAIDPTSFTTEDQLMLDSDRAISGFSAMAAAIHKHGGTVFAQLLHAGREIYSSVDGTAPIAYSASATPSERFRVIPRAMSKAMIHQVVQSYAAAARRAMDAGLDGVELNASHGNLPAQFLAEGTNKRTDEYGGSSVNRIRFLLEVCRAIRAVSGTKIAFGVRLSVADLDNIGQTEDESVGACKAIDAEGLIDFLHAVVGSASSRAGAIHIVAPMTNRAGYVAPYAAKLKNVVRVPVIATGRFNTPQTAEAVLREGIADACGMTRAMICDPELGNKVVRGHANDVRACIGCDQACIGHFQKGYSISCIQFPESGRELTFGRYPSITRRRKILVAGGGPAGMKAAAVAAVRGHQVILCEASAKLGGQALLAERLPGREEFGGIITNLQREVELAGVEVRRNAQVDRRLVEAERPDAVIIATGGTAAVADAERTRDAHVVTAEEVIKGTCTVGQRVVIADNRCDWVGIGVAEKLAAEGHRVRLAVTGVQPGEAIPMYVRDTAAGRLFQAGVEVIPYARLYGADNESVYLEHVSALQPIVLEGVDTLVVSFGRVSDCTLEQELETMGTEVHLVGDCFAPRTAEEAVLDGLKVGTTV